MRTPFPSTAGPLPGETATTEVAVCEDLDAWSAERIQHVLQQALATRPGMLVIDLAGCPSMDEAGVALVLDTHRRAAQIGTTLALRSPSPWLRHTLERTYGQVLLVISGSSVNAPEQDRPGRHRAPAWH